MGWLLAATYDLAMKNAERCLSTWRAELLSACMGDTLEVGAGTGANLPFFPKGLGRLVLTEPDAHMRTQLQKRITTRNEKAIEIIDAPFHELPVKDESFDTIVCMLVLCSVQDPSLSLKEAFRILRPGGQLIFIEHVAADGPDRLRWQQRCEPVWKKLQGNCHLTRTTEQDILTAGFSMDSITRQDIVGELPITRPSIRGIAIRP
jgi:ubiquinone/menaquinone biosynthesis C-methylase UbiE